MKTQIEKKAIFAENLNKILKVRGISLRGYSEFVGISTSTAHAHIHGRCMPIPEVMERIVKLLAYTEEELVSGPIECVDSGEYFNLGECYIFNYIEDGKHMHRPGILQGIITHKHCEFGMMLDYTGCIWIIELDKKEIKRCRTY